MRGLATLFVLSPVRVYQIEATFVFHHRDLRLVAGRPTLPGVLYITYQAITYTV